MEHRGGFVVADFHLLGLPEFTLTGDGRVIVPGAQLAIFPGPILPPIQVRRLNESGVQAVLDAAAASRQFSRSAEWRGAANFVADAADTVFTLNAEGRQVVVAVYALGILDPGGQGLDAEERTAHAALTALRERLSTLDGWLGSDAWAEGGWQAYRADALRLVVRNADGDPPQMDGIEVAEVAWPTNEDPAAFGEPTAIAGLRCGVVSGQQAEAWYEALAAADQATRWVAGGHRYEVGARPVLPDEEHDCPQAG